MNEIEHYYEDGTEPTILRRPRIPLGCDQQGRYPQAAEAATEIGVGDPKQHWWYSMAVDAALALALVVTLYLIILVVL